MDIKLPEKVEEIIEILHREKYEAYAVGGCIRDSLIDRIPNDWDICTDCKPDNIIEIFNRHNIKTIPTGLKHGTVTILIDNESYEITTFRIEGEYLDNRRPSKVEFTNNIVHDLSRRDFTINAMAYNSKNGLIDPFSGKKDLYSGIIKTVGDSDERFNEDALRIIRGVRFATQLKFNLECRTIEGIKNNKELLSNISKERINAELNKILLAERPSIGLYLLKELSLMDYIIPELSRCFNFDQKNPHHHKDVFDHTMTVLDNTEDDLILRLAALLHDIGKPSCFSVDEKGIGHFYRHHVVGAEMVGTILRTLKYDKKTIKQVKALVKEHMTKHDDLSDKAVKRLINRVGIDNVERLFKLQRADIKGSRPPHDFSRIEYLHNRCQEILNEKQPLSITDLEINGYDLINLGVKQGKDIGRILDYLLDRVLEDSTLNQKDKLIEIVNDKFINN